MGLGRQGVGIQQKENKQNAVVTNLRGSLTVETRFFTHPTWTEEAIRLSLVMIRRHVFQ